MALFACKVGGSEGGEIDVKGGVDISSSFSYKAGSSAVLSSSADLSEYKMISLTLYCGGAVNITPSSNRTVSSETNCKAGLSAQRSVGISEVAGCFMRDIVLTEIEGAVDVRWNDSTAASGPSVIAIGYKQ